MFGVLFWKECGQVLRSLVYYIYVVVFVLFIVSQMSDSEWLAQMEEPQPGQGYYGTIKTTDQGMIMERTLANLVEAVYRNSFATYPIGFYKGVTLNESEKAQAEEILERCTGKSLAELEAEREAHYGKFGQSRIEDVMEAQTTYKVSVKEGFTYAEFEAAMEEICGIVGKGSSFEKEKYENSISVPMTYEQAKEEYEALCSEDRFTRAYMRLFCDYAGIVLSVLPIFVGVSRAMRDRRAKVQQVIFSKTASGAVIIGSRYLANLVMLCLPVAISAFLLQQPFFYKAQTLGQEGDIFAFLTVPGLWLVPEIMVVLALSFLLTELTDTIVAVFVQTAWGIGSVFGAASLVGDFGMKLVARWNTLGETTSYLALRKELLVNRGYYFLLALICVAATVIVYEKKRGKGESFYGKIRKADV